jgi:uncharacterized protein YcsI (UPF0317 family)
LPAPGESSKKAGSKMNQSQHSFTSGMSSSTNKTNFLALNKDRAKDYNPYKKPMICDTLDDKSQSRLAKLTEDIDGDLDQFIK